MTDLLDNGETPARKPYLRTPIGAIIVGDKSVRNVGSKEAVRAAILGKSSPPKTFVVWDRNGAPDTIRTCGRLRRAGLVESGASPSVGRSIGTLLPGLRHSTFSYSKVADFLDGASQL